MGYFLANPMVYSVLELSGVFLEKSQIYHKTMKNFHMNPFYFYTLLCVDLYGYIDSDVDLWGHCLNDCTFFTVLIVTINFTLQTLGMITHT